MNITEWEILFIILVVLIMIDNNIVGCLGFFYFYFLFLESSAVTHDTHIQTKCLSLMLLSNADGAPVNSNYQNTEEVI